MAFAVAVDDEEFKQYLTSLIVTVASVEWLFLLLIRSVDLRLTKYRKLFNVVMGLQLLFAMVRNLSTLLLSSFDLHFEPQTEQKAVQEDEN
ncbi:hypothetical protein BG000_002939 [Podila horticola]|nr:hypothetical protein BG000_002939 [Podila horticola]